MATVTFDTNLVDDQQLLAVAHAAGFVVAHTTVTDRELSGSGVMAAAGHRAQIFETIVLGESVLGASVLGSDSDATNFERVLKIISSGAFPVIGKRDRLSSGQRRQLRDAMIFCAHVREKRDVFVTNDRRGFINNGHRPALEQDFSTKIYTADEFLALCNDSQSKTNV